MLAQINLGTNNLEGAEEFYTNFLSLTGGSLLFKTEKAVIYATGDGGARLSINKPHDGKPASVGNGAMATFFVSSEQQVEQLYSKAMELGGSCEGKPGERMGGVIHAAYFRDLDGNKVGLIFIPEG